MNAVKKLFHSRLINGHTAVSLPATMLKFKDLHNKGVISPINTLNCINMLFMYRVFILKCHTMHPYWTFVVVVIYKLDL